MLMTSELLLLLLFLLWNFSEPADTKQGPPSVVFVVRKDKFEGPFR